MRQVSCRNIRRACESHVGLQHSVTVQLISSVGHGAVSAWSSSVGISHPKLPWGLLIFAGRNFDGNPLQVSFSDTYFHVKTEGRPSQELYLLTANWVKHLRRDFAITLACFNWVLKTNPRTAGPFPVTRRDCRALFSPLRDSKHEIKY